MLVLMAGLVAGLFYWRVIRPLVGRVSDDALLYEVEIRHPELNENLISGAQLARDGDLEAKGVSMELAEATIARSKELARGMDFLGTVDQTRFARNLALMIRWIGLVCRVWSLASTRQNF